MKKLLLLFTSALLLLPPACHLKLQAQDTLRLTEREYKGLVLENNLRLQAARSQVKAAGEELAAGRKDHFPGIDLKANYWHFDERVTGGGMPVIRQDLFNAGLDLYQNIYSGGRVSKNIKLLEIYEEQARTGQKIAENELLYLASMTFWTAVSSEEELAILKAFKKRYESFQQGIRDRVESAISSKNELNMTKVRLNTIELQILQAEKSSEVAHLNLRKLARISLDSAISISDTIVFNRLLPDTTDLVIDALERRPEVAMLRQEVLASEQLEALIVAGYLPSVGISLGGQFTNGIAEAPNGDFHYNLHGGVSMPLVRWGKKRSEKRMQQQRTEASRYLLEDHELEVSYEIAEAYYEMQQSIRQADLATEAFREARENLRITRDRYDEGLATIYEVSEAESFLLDATLLLFRYRSNYKFGLVNLERALGRLNPKEVP